MNDRELLERAAKAAGIIGKFQGKCEYYKEWGIFPDDGCDHTDFWNPLTDDGDALRLAVQLRINIQFGCDEECCVNAYRYDSDCDVEEMGGDDCNKNTRRAIVRAAAEIGKSMK